MPFEIYYTSAPSGIKPGQQGFCTVGASEGIPKPLWERLESLSGYRHEFEAGDARNAVAQAHWIVRTAGKTWHVLSRICDAGLDYTQRNNAFAHHVAMEGGELAPAGPAWMLAQAGVMVERWDGRTGSIGSRSLPRGDAPAGRCTLWQQATGDAGWAGVLADAFVKNPAKPVGIIFGPQHDMLGLIDEAIRLLPPDQRWNVTFSTYFTSVPTSAVCNWRCYLAGTRAAVAAVRSAGTGLVIDLTDISKAGAITESAMVTAARTGRSAHKAAPPPSSQPVMQRSKERWRSAKDHEPIPFADDVPVSGGSPSTDVATLGASSRSRPVRLPKAPTSDLNEADLAASTARPWRRLALLYIGACVALGIGTILVIRAAQSSGPPEDVPQRPVRANPVSQPVEKQPVIPVSRPTVIDTPTTVIVRNPATTKGSDTQIVIAPPVPPPEPIVLRDGPPRPAVGGGVNNRMQPVPLRPEQFDNLRAIASIDVLFPNKDTKYVCKKGDVIGALSITAENTLSRPALVLRWKDAIGAGGPIDVLTIQLDKSLEKNRPQLEFTWRANTVLNRADVASLTWWLLRCSTWSFADAAKARPQPIEWAPVELRTVDLKEKSMGLGLPHDLPPGVTPEVEKLSDGWTSTVRLHWKDADKQTPQNAWRAVELRRPGIGAMPEQLVIILLAPGYKSMESDLAARVSAAETDLGKAKSELATIQADIAKTKEAAAQEIDGWKNAVFAPPNVEELIRNREKKLLDDLKPLEDKLAEENGLVKIHTAAVERFAELAEIDIGLKLADGLRVAGLKFRTAFAR